MQLFSKLCQTLETVQQHEQLKLISLVSNVEIVEKIARFFASEDINDECEQLNDEVDIVKLPLKSRTNLPEVNAKSK